MTFRRALRSIGEMMSASGTINTPITASIQNTSTGEQVDLRLQRPSHPGNRLRRRVRGVRTLRLEVARHRVDGLLIADIGGCGMLDQAALMELLALRQNSLRQ